MRSARKGGEKTILDRNLCRGEKQTGKIRSMERQKWKWKEEGNKQTKPEKDKKLGLDWENGVVNSPEPAIKMIKGNH